MIGTQTRTRVSAFGSRAKHQEAKVAVHYSEKLANASHGTRILSVPDGDAIQERYSSLSGNVIITLVID